MGLSTSAATVNKVVGSVVTTSSGTSGRPVMRVPPLNVTGSQGQTPAGNGQSPQQAIRCGIVTRHAQKESEKAQTKERPKSEFYLVIISQPLISPYLSMFRIFCIHATKYILTAAVGRRAKTTETSETPSSLEYK